MTRTARGPTGRLGRALLTAGLSVTLSAGLLAGAPAKDLPAPQTDIVPPVEVVISAKGSSVECAPAELRLPAQTNVHLRLINHSDHDVTITAPGIFENRNVLHHDGDVVHVASNEGYTVKSEGHGDIEFRSLAAGEHTFGCTSVQNQSAPFRGKLVFVPPA